ncbi:hypothetical protein ABZ816_32270 [Actinosynnema sp. NPDC047251]|uniref:Putative secreted protein n=1 Tax=Saccharothrix espanaensis (strain ATCC 51144 / DSM 44229 / JCM 9112 / NBRC 15066 / NRRL 15764) TaxID=1179773 RepID=K0JVD1_SACES|nr:hypothetical protein [Saccharothrix espanaensis]CCH29941.1 putative secreted protein [Saccharothrix espanaensis DSM 44229]
MFWLFAQMFFLCGFAFLAGALLTWLPLRATIRALRAERPRQVVRPALPATAVIIPEQSNGPEQPDGRPHPEPHTAELGTGDLDPAEPATAELGVAEPATAEPATAEPVTAEPATAGLGVADTEPHTNGQPYANAGAHVNGRPHLSVGAHTNGRPPANGESDTVDATTADALEDPAESESEPEPEPGFEVKGSSKSMIFHTPDSPYFKRMKGDVAFRSIEEAERAGYTQWRPKSAAAASTR